MPFSHGPGGRAPALRTAVGLLAAGCLAATAPGAATALASRPGPGAGQTVRVVAGRPLEFAFSLSTDRVHTGAVTFLVANAGRIPHDFSIDGRKTPSLRPGGQTRITVWFGEPGLYEYVCTLPGHAMAGMVGDLVVTRGPLSPT